MNNLVKRNNVSYDPFVDFYNMETFFPSFVGPSKSFPSVNISEDDKNYCVDVVAPGFKKDDFKINVENDMLTISAEAKSEYNNDENNNQQEEKSTKSQSKGQEKNQSNNNNQNNGSNGNEHKRQYSRREYSYSSFTRSFRLPENTRDDSITAKYKDGILELMIPKSKEEEKATKQIPVA